MKVYLIFDMADIVKMSIQEAYDIKQRFFMYARMTGKQFTYDLLANESNHLYRVGLICENFDEEYSSVPQIKIPRNDLGWFGACIDLSQLTPEQIDRETFYFKPK